MLSRERLEREKTIRDKWEKKKGETKTKWFLLLAADNRATDAASVATARVTASALLLFTPSPGQRRRLRAGASCPRGMRRFHVHASHGRSPQLPSCRAGAARPRSSSPRSPRRPPAPPDRAITRPPRGATAHLQPSPLHRDRDDRSAAARAAARVRALQHRGAVARSACAPRRCFASGWTAPLPCYGAKTRCCHRCEAQNHASV